MVFRKNLILLLIGSLFLLPILKYYSLNSSIFDMGIFQCNIYNNSIYGLGFAHIQIFQAIYSFFNTEYLLILLQSSLVITSMYYVYKQSFRYKIYHLLVFLLSYAVWYNVLFDFHFDNLSIPFIFAFYYFIKEQKYKSAFVIGILVSLIKEPFALVTSFMGIYMIIKSKEYLKGSLLLIYGVVYFYIATYYIMPFFTPDYGLVGNDSYALFGAGGSLVDIALYPITHFQEFIIDIITTKKIVYLIVLFSAFGLVVVFFSPLELIPAIPPLGIAMLSNVENFYWYNTHYTAPLIAPFMVAFIYGLPRFILFCKKNIKYLDSEKKILILVFIPIILSHIVFSPSPISRFFWIERAPQYYHTVYIPTERTAKIKEAILKYIPKDTNISVASQNTLNWGYLAHRKYYFAFPQGVIEDTSVVYVDSDSFIDVVTHLINQDKTIVKSKKVRADYVTIDMKRALYLIDKSVTKEQFIKVVNKMRENYEVVYEYDEFFIYIRKNLNE